MLLTTFRTLVHGNRQDNYCVSHRPFPLLILPCNENKYVSVTKQYPVSLEFSYCVSFRPGANTIKRFLYQNLAILIHLLHHSQKMVILITQSNGGPIASHITDQIQTTSLTHLAVVSNRIFENIHRNPFTIHHTVNMAAFHSELQGIAVVLLE